MTNRRPIVAIDGPVGSGKTTTARLAAEKLGFLYVDSGAMYRAVTVAVLDRGIASDDESRVEQEVLPGIDVDLRFGEGGQLTFLNGRDVSSRIRDLDVTRAVSAVSAQKAVRDAMTGLQRRLGRDGGIVMEGRDIGTVVFPDAEYKIYLDASIEVRAQRRYRELTAKGVEITLATLVDDIRERDRANSERAIAPLRKAPGAIVIDTSGMTIDGQVDAIVSIVNGEKT